MLSPPSFARRLPLASLKRSFRPVVPRRCLAIPRNDSGPVFEHAGRPAPGVNPPPADEIPVVKAGGRDEAPTHGYIKLNRPLMEQAPEPIQVNDTSRKAVAFTDGLGDKLTPTLKKFALSGKVAVVTGGARGLGWNMSQALAEAGVKGIALLDVQHDLGVKQALDLYQSTGVPTRFYQTDIRDAPAVSAVFEQVKQDLGSIDIVLNSAGIADSNRPAETYDLEEYKRLIAINVTGAFVVSQAAGRHMIAQNSGGSIILVASMSGSIVNYPQEQSCYNVSKAAVIQMAKSLAAEWAKFGIRVNSISPGYMDTALNRVPQLEDQKRIWNDRTPLGRLGAVDELNGLALYLASDASSYMTGSNLIIDGGYTVW